MLLRVAFALLFVILFIGGIIYVQRPAPTATRIDPPVVKRPAPRTPQAHQDQGSKNLYIGHTDATSSTAHTVLTTRKSEKVYQALVRYQPRQVAVAEVPGLPDLQQIMQLPSTVMRLDQDTEMLIDNLGEPSRSVTSSHLYLDPVTAHVIAYDIANTSGGQAQRFVGHRTKSGITIDVFRGGEVVDRHEVPFASRDTFIPVEMEFIHQWYESDAEAREASRPVTFSIFIPEVMTTLYLIAKPMGTQVIPIKDSTHECARYEVTTVSTQSVEMLKGRQEMWFDKRTGLLMKREDFEASLGPGDAPVTERGAMQHLAQVEELMVRPPPLPAKAFPYALERDLVYKIKVRDGDIGRLRFSYSQVPAKSKVKNTYSATATVSLDAKGSSRHEASTTGFDENWMPVVYEAVGDEYGDGDATANYKVRAELGAGNIEVTLHRDVLDAPTGGGSGAAKPIAKTEPAAESDWRDPLVRVPITDEEMKAQQTDAKQRTSDHVQKRRLSTGTYLFDFNRVEHIAAMAYRLPLPKVAANPEEQKAEHQKVAIYSVRQNRCGVIMFEIKPEPRPALTERQKLRVAARDREDPQLYVANCASAILPCRMLLKEDGTLMELTLKLGNNEVTYTLDDPIMRRRTERTKKQKMQEGPQLIRPPWW